MTVVPLRHLAVLNAERHGEDPAPLLTLDLIESGTGRLLGGCWGEEREPPAAGVADVRTGDVLFGKLRPYLAKVVLVQRRAYASTELLCLRPRTGVDPAWFFYRMLSKPVIDWAVATSDGTKMPRTSWERLGAFATRIPSLRAQRAIANYLNSETARIDAIIIKRQRLMNKLEERFEYLVFSAVTRGLRNEPLTPSGLPWVSHIPQTWGTPAVVDNFELQLGKMLSAEAAQGPDLHPYLRNVNVQWDRLFLEDLAMMHFSPLERRKFSLAVGDLLVCEGGEVGRSAVWTGELADCYFQKAIHRLRPSGTADSRFLMYCLRAAAKLKVFAVEGNTSTIVHLTREQLRAHRFPWPPPREQAEIVGFLDMAARRTTEARGSISRQIGLLRERRQALITVAVADGVQVPGAAA